MTQRRPGRRAWLYAGLAGLALAASIPVIAQQGPTSLLPPGFGDDEAVVPPAPTPVPSPSAPAQRTRPAPGLQLDLTDIGGPGPAAAPAVAESENATAPLDPDQIADLREKYDLPPGAGRPLDRIGALDIENGGLEPDAFGATPGPFLVALMREARAPFVSRWGSIMLRRALLSEIDTPSGVNGADWAAERAWLLLRMGEADSARLMVQSVDTDKYTPRMYDVAMQAYLAAADPAGLCPIRWGGGDRSEARGWKMADAFCASFSGEQGTASAILNHADRDRAIAEIDYRLTEKLVGAGINARRSVKIEWEGVDRLTMWRFGLATALNVDIPDALLASGGARIRAWRARAPMLSPEQRKDAVETAARLGVFSSAALVDFYGQLASGPEVPVEHGDRARAIADAYAGPTVGRRIEAMRQLWVRGEGLDYVGLLSVARAAAILPVAEAGGADISALIAAMMSAGYDSSAARWARAEGRLEDSAGALGWALLAVGAPQPVVTVNAERARAFVQEQGAKGPMLLAALAGLGRLSPNDVNELSRDEGVGLGGATKWTRAIDAAARRGEKGTVALLVAVGMQTANWRDLPPRHLYHIVSALRSVGMDAEARMIAAEAVTRT